LPFEVRDKISGNLDHLKVQLALGQVEGRDAVLAQKEKIGQAVRRAESQIDQIEQQANQERAASLCPILVITDFS
jgi:phage-related minor tail protein